MVVLLRPAVVGKQQQQGAGNHGKPSECCNRVAVCLETGYRHCCTNISVRQVLCNALQYFFTQFVFFNIYQ